MGIAPEEAIRRQDDGPGGGGGLKVSTLQESCIRLSRPDRKRANQSHRSGEHPEQR
jgi:hypothetical protein